MSAILETLFNSVARVQVLDLFLANSGSQFHQREIERQTGLPIRAVQREVERLEGIGLLLRSPEANRVLYRLNPDFPLLAELTALFQVGASARERPQPRRPERRPARSVPPAAGQPFGWMETPPTAPLPAALREVQVEGEWDRAY